ncbi:hypothetical protein BVY02_01510 [bacterium J17]|nr:hypothetical protein BVY02_01510 [bacterium J17]
MQVRIATDTDGSQWNAYLERKDIAHHAHDWSWRRVLRESFRHVPKYLIAETGGEICGVMPLFHVRSLIFGESLISMPYLNGGGPISDSQEVETALVNFARELLKEIGAKYLELRLRNQNTSLSGALESRSHKVAMILELSDDPEAFFSSFPPKLRSQIRRPSKSGIDASITPGHLVGSKDIRALYSVFSENMRDLGTPVYPKKLFSLTCKYFGRRAKVITAWQKKQAVASGLTISTNGHVEIPWASSLRKFNREAPNMLLYWQSIKSAIEDGDSYFDFGRSTPDSGTFKFKKQWGAEPLPLHWFYDTNGCSIPDVNPNDPKYNRLVKAWQKLPLPIANSLGPFLTRGLP